jgi:hypothetical protein
LLHNVFTLLINTHINKREVQINICIIGRKGKKFYVFRPVQMGNVGLPQKNEVKYLGMHLDRRLTNQNKTAQPEKETNALTSRK